MNEYAATEDRPETRDIKVLLITVLMIGTSFAVLATRQILPVSGDSCPPGPKVFGATANLWTPQLLLDSPYLGSATGFSGVSEELDYNFLVTGSQKIDTQGWMASRSNGEAMGVFEVSIWQSVSQQTGCLSTTQSGAQWNGYYVDPATGGIHTQLGNLLPRGQLQMPILSTSSAISGSTQ
jgi:hypothetical protein